MFGDYGKELLKSGIIEAKAGNRESARRYLDRAVYISNHHDVLAEAWFWMSEVVVEKDEKRMALFPTHSLLTERLEQGIFRIGIVHDSDLCRQIIW